MDTVLVATDGSDSARAAEAEGLRLAAEQGAKAVLVHVYPPPQSVALTPGFTEFPAEIPAVELPPPEEDAVLAAAAAAARERGVPTELRVTSGDAVWEILAAAEDAHADVIVMGSRGHGTVAGALLGSASHGVLRHARCPVLVVHPPKA